MGYEVLARKWRPQTFDDVIGQEHITRTLKKAVESSRLSHAYLFSGPRGCGKTSTARILAKVINCRRLKGGNPCDECESCVGVRTGRNLDVMEIDGASHTGVAEVRDLQESIGYAPSQNANKIYIIDEVHMLSTHAFNALLKTLEEPPSHVYFVFATTAPHKIPDTIKSRCQRHQFKRLEIGEITGHLETICKAENVDYEVDALRLLARKAEGSMRDGESLLDQCITAGSGEVSTDSVRDTLGILDQTMVLDFLRTICEGDATAVLRRLDEAIHLGVDLEELLGALIEGYRDLMLLSTGGDLRELIFRGQDEVDALSEVRGGYELPDLVTIVERLCNTAPRLKMASEPRILLESLLVDLSLLERQTDIRRLIDRLEGAAGGGELRGSAKPSGRGRSKGTAAPGQRAARLAPRDDLVETVPAWEAPREPIVEDEERTEPPQSSSESGPTSGSVDLNVKEVDLSSLDYREQRRLWDGFVTYVRQKKVALGVCLISATLKSIEKDTVALKFGRGFSFQKDQVESAANAKFLRNEMQKYFGRALDLVCLGDGEELPANQRKSAGVEGEATPSRPIEHKPIVKKILDDFDGEIVRYHPQ